MQSWTVDARQPLADPRHGYRHHSTKVLQIYKKLHVAVSRSWQQCNKVDCCGKSHLPAALSTLEAPPRKCQGCEGLSQLPASCYWCTQSCSWQIAKQSYSLSQDWCAEDKPEKCVKMKHASSFTCSMMSTWLWFVHYPGRLRQPLKTCQ